MHGVQHSTSVRGLKKCRNNKLDFIHIFLLYRGTANVVRVEILTNLRNWNTEYNK